MPTFEIALDDGRKFHVEAESQDAALAGIQQHIGQPQKQGGGVVDAARAGASDFVSGLGETASRNLGLTGVGEALKNAGEKIAPAQRPNSTLYDQDGFHAGNIPAALAEASPSTAAAMAAMRVMPGPIWAKLAAGGAVGLGSMLGLHTQQATEKRTGDKNAPSTQEDVEEALKRAAPEAAVQALPLGRLLPGTAARLGVKGVVGSLGRTAADAAAMGAGGAGAQAYDQLYQNGDVDPNQVIDAAARNALVGGAFGAKRSLGDVKAAIKYRGISDEDPAHIAEASNRIFQSANNLDVNPRTAKGGGQALESARSDVETEFKNAVDRIKGSGEDKNDLSLEAQRALARAQKGLPLSDADTAVLTAASGDEGAVADLQRLGGVSRVLNGVKGIGHFDATTGKLTGGLSGAMEHHVRALANPLGAGVSAGLATVGGAHLGDVFAHSPEALAALGGTYGLARLADFMSGSRSPAGSFASRFADPSVGIPPTSGLDALNRMAANPNPQNPTGPKIGMAPTPWGPTPPEMPPARPAMNPTGPSVAQAPTPWGPTPPAPVNPSPLPLDPLALKMLKAKLKSPPQAPAPEAPQQPQFSPIAMKMLLDKLKNPPQAPQAPAVNAPVAAPTADVPSVQTVTAPPPQAVPAAIRNPQVADNAPPAKITKSEKNGVKVEAAKSELNIPEDLSIPDFLKRLPQPVVAQKAMAKLNKIDLTPDREHTAEEFAMSPKEYAAHKMAQYTPEESAKFKGREEAQSGAIERRVQAKADLADRLAAAFPKVGERADFYKKLFAANTSAPIRKLRDDLASAHPDKADFVKGLLADHKLRTIWKYVGK